MPKKKSLDPIINIFGKTLNVTSFSPMIRDVPRRKIENFEAPSSLLSNALKIANFGSPC